MKHYFVADAHLGSRLFDDNDAKIAHFIEWLNMATAEESEIYLLGDIFDFWFEFAHTIPPGFDRLLNALRQKTQQGTRIHFFCGNHDQWTYGHLRDYCGLIVHKKGDFIDIEGKRFYLAHGHGLGEKRRTTLILNRIFESPIAQWLFRHLMIPRLGYAFGYRWSARNRKKHDSIENINRHHNYYEAHTTDSNAFQVEWAKQFSTEHPDINYIIMGHLHQEINMRLGSGCQLLILDEFYQNYGYAIYDGTHLWPENFISID